MPSGAGRGKRGATRDRRAGLFLLQGLSKRVSYGHICACSVEGCVSAPREENSYFTRYLSPPPSCGCAHVRGPNALRFRYRLSLKSNEKTKFHCHKQDESLENMHGGARPQKMISVEALASIELTERAGVTPCSPSAPSAAVVLPLAAG